MPSRDLQIMIKKENLGQVWFKMAGNVHNTNTMSGGAMAVLAGVVLTIGPWFTPIGFFSKLIVSIIGIVLVIIGTRN